MTGQGSLAMPKKHYPSSMYNFMKKIILIFLCLSSSVWAYVPDNSFLDRTQKITEKMNRAIARMPSSTQSSFVQTA